MATVSSKYSTFLSGYQERAWGICHILNNTWLLFTTLWIENANTVFRKELKEWLLGCFIILYFLLVLSDLELSLKLQGMMALRQLAD